MDFSFPFYRLLINKVFYIVCIFIIPVRMHNENANLFSNKKKRTKQKLKFWYYYCQTVLSVCCYCPVQSYTRYYCNSNTSRDIIADSVLVAAPSSFSIQWSIDWKPFHCYYCIDVRMLDLLCPLIFHHT